MRKLYKNLLSYMLVLALMIQFGPSISKAGEEFILAYPIKAFYTAQDAADQVDARATYKAGKYYVYNKFNGMLNISIIKDLAGAWINPYKNSAIERLNDQDRLGVGLIKEEDNLFTVKLRTLGYLSADQAEKEDPEGVLVKPGLYHIYSTYGDMINITKLPGQPGNWINPHRQEEIKPIIPQTTNK